ncbi:hypothetical protein Bbelb_414070 [Branchiostoma belcheri]|nr:hypothetical protein Bbelb_414070 [Branchiostoma belcheri]
MYQPYGAVLTLPATIIYLTASRNNSSGSRLPTQRSVLDGSGSTVAPWQPGSSFKGKEALEHSIKGGRAQVKVDASTPDIRAPSSPKVGVSRPEVQMGPLGHYHRE